jgi:hypothetical protein
MMKLITTICICGSLAFVLRPWSDGFNHYHPVESYEIRPGVLITPHYSANHEICEISIEKRHYSNDAIDVDGTMSSEQIRQLFDELAPKEERGQPGWKLPESAEVTDVDGGIRRTHVMYENVSLTMYGKAENQKYVAAVIAWNAEHCKPSH